MSSVTQKFWCEIRGQWQFFESCVSCRKQKKCEQKGEIEAMAKTQVKPPPDEISGGPSKKKVKILITGPRGQYKTRAILQMCDVPRDREPILSVIDTENGTEFYGDQFYFRRTITSDPDEITAYVQSKMKKPDALEALALDSHTIYFDAVKSKYADLYLKRMPTSSGHRSEFYVFQPNDHAPYQKEIYDLLRDFIKSPFHFMWTCHSANKWSGMKVIGEKPDGVKGLEHWFDTVIHIYEKSIGTFIATVEKDRTGILVEKKTHPWRNQDDAFALFAPFRDLIQGSNGAAEKSSDKKASEQPPVTDENTTAEEKKPDPPKETTASSTEKKTDDPEAQKAELIEIVKLKTELRIVAPASWRNLLKPYKVETAKEMDADQRKKFIAELEGLRPTQAQAA